MNKLAVLFIMLLSVSIFGQTWIIIQRENGSTDSVKLAENSRIFITTTGAGPALSSNSINMVQVTGGSFTMGEAGWAEPLHQVTLNNYLISKTEITQGQWKSVMGSNPSYFTAVGENAPVEQVSWYDCIKFCNKLSIKEGKAPCYSINGIADPNIWPSDTSSLNHVVRNISAKGYRLPTEAEWEYAARGGSQSHGYTYSGSNLIDNVAGYYSNSKNTTLIVGSRAANELGISDMSGNVWEWCWDWFGSYNNYRESNPTGAENGNWRVVRGGSWLDYDVNCRPTIRYNFFPVNSYYSIGLRVAQDL